MFGEYFWPVKSISIDWLDSWFHFVQRARNQVNQLKYFSLVKNIHQTLIKVFIQNLEIIPVRLFGRLFRVLPSISGHLWYQRPNCHLSWPPDPRGHGQRCTWTSREDSAGAKAMCRSLQTDQQSIDATNKNVITVDMMMWCSITVCTHHNRISRNNAVM